MSEDNPDQLPASYPLISRDDPPPFVVLHEHGNAPALIVCDHASRAFPKGLKRLGLPELPSWQHIAWDIGAGELARGLSNALDAPAVLAGYSRLVVDCNRLPDDPEAFREEGGGWVIPGNKALSEYDKRLRLACFFDPYHECIEAMLAGLKARELVPLIVSIHTFTPEFEGQLRPWQAGILWDKDEKSAQFMIAGLRGIPGVNVGDNQPYSGKHPSDYTIDHHAEGGALPHVCIEIRQDQLESPAGMERWIRILTGLVRQMLDDPDIRRPLGKDPSWQRASRR
jgi:predicted N-formylglutamate amidohydrolase